QMHASTPFHQRTKYDLTTRLQIACQKAELQDWRGKSHFAEIQLFCRWAVRNSRRRIMLVSKELNAAYWALRIAFGLGPLLAGMDKFTNILVNWEKYLSLKVLQIVPLSAVTFMHIVGIVEIIVGLAVLAGFSRFFGYIAMLWLWGIAANLISMGAYYDIAVRDILLGMSAYALARVTEARHSVMYISREPADVRRIA